MTHHEASTPAIDNNPGDSILKVLNSRWKMWFYYLVRLPSILWFGIYIRKVTPSTAEIALPFSWRTKNPFKSIYFAAQCAAAELSTGVLALVATKRKGIKMSLLVTAFQMEFVKKATEKTTFSCEEGEKIREIVEKAILTGEGQEVTVLTTGTLKDGSIVSKAEITWSFKKKN